MATGFWWAFGHVSQAQMSEASHDIANFAVQSDQDTGREWFRPDNEADVIAVGELVDAIDNSRGGYGGYEFVWPMRVLSPKMVDYLWDNLFDESYSAPATVRVPINRSNGAAEFYQVIALWPDIRSDADLFGGGFDKFKIRMVDGVLAPAGPDMTVTVSHVGGVSLGVNEVFTITATNNGDSATFANIVVVATPHASLDFASTSATGWTVEYSTNGGGAYSSTLPTPPNTVTNVRYTRTSALGAGVAADAISFTAGAIAAGTLTLSATVTTTGDTNGANNTATDTFEVNLVSDNQSAFMKGATTATTSKGGYMSGV